MDTHINYNGAHNNGQGKEDNNDELVLVDEKWEHFEKEMQNYCGEHWMDERDKREEALDNPKLLKSIETWDFPLSVMNNDFSFKTVPIQDKDFIRQLNNGNAFEICTHKSEVTRCSCGYGSPIEKCSKCQILFCCRCTPEGNPANLNNQQHQSIGLLQGPNKLSRTPGPQSVPFGFPPGPFPPGPFPPHQHGYPYNSQMSPGIGFPRFPPRHPGMYPPGSARIPRDPYGPSNHPGFMPNQGPMSPRPMFQQQQQFPIESAIGSDPVAKNGLSKKKASKKGNPTYSKENEIRRINVPSRATKGLFLGQSNYGQSPPSLEKNASTNTNIKNESPCIGNNIFGNPSSQNRGQPKTKTAAALKELTTGGNGRSPDEDFCWRNPVTKPNTGRNKITTERNETAKEYAVDYINLSKKSRANPQQIGGFDTIQDRYENDNRESSLGETASLEENDQSSEYLGDQRRNSSQSNSSYCELLNHMDFLSLDNKNENKEAKTNTTVENNKSDVIVSNAVGENDLSLVELAMSYDSQPDPQEDESILAIDLENPKKIETKNMIIDDNKVDAVFLEPETKICDAKTPELDLMSPPVDLGSEEKESLASDNIISPVTVEPSISDSTKPNVPEENTTKQTANTAWPTIPPIPLKFGIANRKNLVKTMMQQEQEKMAPVCQKMPTLEDLKPAQSIDELMKNKEAVFVTHFSSFNTAHIISSIAFHHDLPLVKEDIFEVMESDGGANKFYEPPPVGTVVLAPLDKQYHRAVVEKVCSEAIVIVRFIDVGSTATLGLRNLFQMTKEILNIPILGRQVILKDVIDSNTEMILLSDFGKFVQQWPLQRECYIKSAENLDGCDFIRLEYTLNGISKLVSGEIINLGIWEWQNKWQKTPGITETALCKESNWKANCFEEQIRKLKQKKTKGTVASSTPEKAEVAIILNIANEFYFRDKQVLNNQMAQYAKVVKADEPYFPAIGEYVLVKIMASDNEEFKNLRGLGKWNRCIRKGVVFLNLDECECYPVSMDYRDIFKVRKYCPDFAKVPFFTVNCRIKECWPMTPKNKDIFNAIAKQGNVLTFYAIDSESYDVSCEEYYAILNDQ